VRTEDGSPSRGGDDVVSEDDTESSVRYVVASLVVGVFFGGLGAGVAFPTLPALGPLLGISPFVVGLILSVNRFTRLVANTPAGQVLDRVGTRRPMIAGFVVQGLVPFGYVLGLHADALPVSVGNATVFFLARSFWGFGSAFVFVGAFSTITHVTTPDNRGKWVGYMRGGQSLGFPTGLVVGGLVSDAFGYDVAFGVAGVAGLLAAVVAAAVLPDVSPDVEASRLRDVPGIVGADPRIAAVGAVNLVVRFLFAGVLLSTAVLYAEASGISVGTLSSTGVSGVVMAVSVVGASVATVFVGRYSDRLENRALVALPALAVLAAGFGVLAAVPTLVGVVVAVALVGLGVGGSNPPLMAYLGDISPDDGTGKLGGVYNVFGDLGSTLGPLVALPLVARVGFAVEYLVCAALALGVGFLVARTLLADATPTEAVAPAD
jgi:MFS family permease